MESHGTDKQELHLQSAHFRPFQRCSSVLLIIVLPPPSIMQVTTVCPMRACDVNLSTERIGMLCKGERQRLTGGGWEVTSAPCPQWLGRCVARQSAQQLFALNRASHSPLCLWVPVERNVSRAGIIVHYPDMYLPLTLLSLLELLFLFFSGSGSKFTDFTPFVHRAVFLCLPLV